MKDNDQTSIISIGSINLSGFDASRKDPDTSSVPVLPLRDMILFPDVTFPVSIGRDLSLLTVREAENKELPIGVFCQLESTTETPALTDLFGYGVLADVIKVIQLPDGSTTAILRARYRLKLIGPATADEVIPGAIHAAVEPASDSVPRSSDKEFHVLGAELKATVSAMMKPGPDSSQTSTAMPVNINDIEDPSLVINMISTFAPLEMSERRKLISLSRVRERGMQLLAMLAKRRQFYEIREEIRRKAMSDIDYQQRRQFLHQISETVREELGGPDNVDDADKFKNKVESLILSDDIRTAMGREIEKLRRLNPQSPDYAVQYSYLQLLTELPWGIYDPLNTDFAAAEQILDSDHYGLEKVKERILEQLAVMMNTPEGRSPIICLVGAPGVGKTSLGQSIARALGRKYQRVSLGGVHDESEIRGHRRTYIGAMAGRIMDAIRRAGSSNPVLLLDEIDKTGHDIKGDPSAALLEVLDPEQNNHFHDNFVDLDYDLSHVLFIATANTTSTIPSPLLDRMEVIDISGYLLEEKIEIATRHLIPEEARHNGFDPAALTFTPEALTAIIEGYTGESGVRQLRKMIAKIVRRIVMRKMQGREFSLTVTPEMVREDLGMPTYSKEKYSASGTPGVAVGLAWTAVGGEILFIESSWSEAKSPEKLTLTGNLGDVMKESAVIALHVVRNAAPAYGVDSSWFEGRALHVHVPEGAIPKDGPSAGITLASSILSSVTGRPLREKLAMTGELTLTGKVLPVGGIKEKILAAKRAGIDHIILCKDNRKDIDDITHDYLKGLTFSYVSRIEEVFEIALPSLDNPPSDNR